MPPTAVESAMVVNLCVPYGSWRGHPSMPIDITPEVGRQILAYFDAVKQRGKDATVIDYGHASLEDSDAPAAGWFYELFEDMKADPPGLYMRNTWTPRAKDGIDKAEFKYLSPVLMQNYTDPVTGDAVPWCLFNVALTNIPFMEDKFRPVTAAKALDGATLYLNSATITNAIRNTTAITNQGTPMDPTEMLGKLVSALGLPPETGWDQIESLAKKFKELASLFPTGGGAPAMPTALPEMEEAMTTAAANSKALVDIAKLLKCDAKDALAAVAKLHNDAPADEDKAKIAAMAQQLAEMKADKLISENEDRIKPADRQMYRDMAVHSYDQVAKIVATFDKRIPEPAAKPAPGKTDDAPPDLVASIRQQLNTTHLHKEEK